MGACYGRGVGQAVGFGLGRKAVCGFFDAFGGEGQLAEGKEKSLRFGESLEAMLAN